MTMTTEKTLTDRIVDTAKQMVPEGYDFAVKNEDRTVSLTIYDAVKGSAYPQQVSAVFSEKDRVDDIQMAIQEMMRPLRDWEMLDARERGVIVQQVREAKVLGCLTQLEADSLQRELVKTMIEAKARRDGLIPTES